MNTAILFDTMSIQQYVFGSNKLKDNLGASYIVEHIYDYLEKKSENNPKDIEIGYVGGGNALVFTFSEEKAKEIVKEYTTELLYMYPGVSLAVGIKKNFRNDEVNYSHDIKELFKILAENKGKYMPVNTISSHGITDICRFSSLSVEVIEIYPDKTIELMSSPTATKRIYEGKARDKEEELLIEADLINYCFPNELDYLGQKKGEDSHIAVVHIDGNGFGEVFRNLKSISGTKDLSERLKKIVRDAFVYALKEFDTNKCILESDLKKQDDVRKRILPIRPIVLGGDDVTFVCHGKLGIWFAEKFMEKFNSNFIDENRTIPFSSCAGVAIVKTKYPFYRAYQLAEELCENAKKMNKKYGGNWIDFQLAYSGLGNTLEEVRKLQYFDVKGNKPLHNRPYCLEKTAGQFFINELKVFTATLKNTLPNSKIKDLREMLTRDKESQKVFIEHLKHQHNEDKGFNESFCKNLVSEEILNSYPFFDMIELLELYPTNLLK